MDATTLLITVYCLIDDWLAGRRLRQRGPQPILSDSEVLTIECVGEFLGIDTDKGLYEHFRYYYRDWFPALGRVHRTTFTRQVAYLWAVKAQLRQQLLDQVSSDPAVSILDSLPIPVCRFGRAYRCRRLAGLAAFGRDEGAKQTYYGLRAHLRVCWPGVICDGHLAPANLVGYANSDVPVSCQFLDHGLLAWGLLTLTPEVTRNAVEIRLPHAVPLHPAARPARARPRRQGP